MHPYMFNQIAHPYLLLEYHLRARHEQVQVGHTDVVLGEVDDRSGQGLFAVIAGGVFEDVAELGELVHRK